MLSLKPSKVSSGQPMDLEKPFKASDVKDVALDEPSHSIRTSPSKRLLLPVLVILLYLCSNHSCLSYLVRVSYRAKQVDAVGFYHNITRPRFSCVMEDGHPTSFAGTIGLKGDSDESPKRSFFWYFEAENTPQDAPIILSIGGGPGTSGMMNGLNGQSRCAVTPSSTIEYNSNGWTEHFNLLLLDHPVNAGYSYGTRVNNSHDAAIDVYDFLQKFFEIFPKLRKNKLVLSGGSYGGIYIPNIAAVIHANNKAHFNGIPKSKHARPINLDSIMLSNPITEPLIYHEWLLEYRCNMHQIYNSTICRTMFSNLPKCLETIKLAYQYRNVQYRTLAQEVCFKYVGDTPTDVVLEDIRRKCEATDPARCHPFFTWANGFFQNESTKIGLGLAGDRRYLALDPEVRDDFWAFGDQMQPHQELLIPVMQDGIRVLCAQDANCAWPGVFSSLRQFQGPHQTAFLSAPEVLWDPGLNQKVVVKQVGKGAGDFTYILIDEAGHFVVHDQPKLAKMIAEHWIHDIPFVNASDLN